MPNDPGTNDATNQSTPPPAEPQAAGASEPPATSSAERSAEKSVELLAVSSVEPPAAPQAEVPPAVQPVEPAAAGATEPPAASPSEPPATGGVEAPAAADEAPLPTHPDKPSPAAPPPEVPRIGPPGTTLIVRRGLMRTVGQFRHDLPAPPAPGARVVIRTDRGVEMGEVVVGVGTECSLRTLTPDALGRFLSACAGCYPLRTEGTVLRSG